MSVQVLIHDAPDLDNNPNEYDDDAFTRASMEFQDAVGAAVEALWEAGARRRDIEAEFANVLENTII